MAANKLDLYREHKTEYVTPKTPVLLRIKPAVYLAIDGQGEPGGKRFVAAIGALYAVAFTLKVTRKFAGKQDYAITKLEGLWFDDVSRVASKDWRWMLMIRTPPFIKTADVCKTIAALIAKGKPSEVKDVKLQTIREGRCVQVLHVGPYDQEARTIAGMRQLAETHGLIFTGPHHEIYLSDPRRVPAVRLRTILRQPVR